MASAADIRALVAEAKATESIDRILELSRHDDAAVRVAALGQICPCRVKKDVDRFWERVFGTCRLRGH